MPFSDSPAPVPAPAPANPGRGVEPVMARVQLGGDDPGIAFQLGSGETRAWLGLAGQASYLTLLDEQQRVRGQLALGAEGPKITFADAERRARAQVRLGAEGAGIALFDTAGETRVWLGLAGDSSYLGLVDGAGNIHGRLRLRSRSGTPGLALSDEHGADRALVAMEADGPHMVFLAGAGEIVAHLAVTELGAWLALVDPDGQPTAELAVADTAVVALRDGEQRRRAVVALDAGKPCLAVLGADGTRAAELRAECLPLWNERGQMRAHLGMTEGGAAIRLFSPDGVQRAALHADADGPCLAIAGDSRQGRAILRCTSGGPELVLGAEGSGPEARMAWHDDGWEARLGDGGDEPRALFHQPAAGPAGIELRDANQRLRLRQQSSLTPAATTSDAVVAMLAADGTPAAQVRLPPDLSALPSGFPASGATKGQLQLAEDGPSLTLAGAAHASGRLRLAVNETAATAYWTDAAGAEHPWLQFAGDAATAGLLDPAGRLRGAWATDTTTCRLELHDAQASPRALLAVTDAGMRLGLLPAGEGSTAWFGVGGEATSYLGLMPDAGPLTALLAMREGETALAILDPSANQRAELAVDAEGPRLTLAAGNRRPQAQIRMQAGGAAIAFLDNDGAARGWLALDTGDGD